MVPQTLCSLLDHPVLAFPLKNQDFGRVVRFMLALLYTAQISDRGLLWRDIRIHAGRHWLAIYECSLSL